MSALTAVFELTSIPDHADRYDITVYQMGHRLGGKGASGCNSAHGDRIEEHGLHVLMGFYHNAFSVLRRCYAELRRAPGAPLSTLEDAVKPHNFLAIAEQVDDRWEPWPLRFPSLPGKLGVDVPERRSQWGYLKKIVARMFTLLTDSSEGKRVAPGFDEDCADVDKLLGRSPAPHAFATEQTVSRGPLEDEKTAGESPRAFAEIDASDIDPARLAEVIDNLEGSRAFVSIPAYLYLSRLLIEVAAADPEPRLLWLLRRFRSWLSGVVSRRIERSTPLRRFWIILDLGLTTVIGALADEVHRAPEGWFSLDDLDLCEWLGKHGASTITRESALVRSLYNLAFTAPGRLAAGTIVHAALRILFDYKEGIFQKMQAGMGDVVFAPLYLVLKRRGVRFEFFHRIDDLVVSPEGERIIAIKMARQARLLKPEYDPLYDVAGLPCWPSEPRYELIEGGAELRASGQNLESAWSTWPDVERRQIEVGRDFDRVILGISIGAFPFVCKQLIAANERFAAMVTHVKTTQTQAVQLWFKGSLGSLGWKLDSPVLDGYAAPFDTWADMSHLLPRERWGGEKTPRSIAYLCSHLPDDEAPPERGATGYAERQAARVRTNAITWLNESAHGLWPEVARATAGALAFDWEMLVDPEERPGVERLEAQYWQATYSPSERYVLAVPGSTKYRLRADESGFENLVLAGDWTRNGMNVGCLEGAVMAGMQASRAISGRPERIEGEE